MTVRHSAAKLGPGTADAYADELQALTTALVAYRYAEHQVKGSGDPAGPGDAYTDAGVGGSSAGRRWPAEERGRADVPVRAQDPRLNHRRRRRPILCGICSAAFS